MCVPLVSSCNCSWSVIDALYVLNTLAVSPSISSDKCLFSIAVYEGGHYLET